MSVVLNCLNTITESDQITENLSIGALNTPVQATSAPTYAFTNGTSTGGTVPYVIDLHWELSGLNAVTLASGASVTYTLSALVDTGGRTIALARVHKFLLWLISRIDGDYLSVGNATVHAWTGLCSVGTTLVPCYDEIKHIAANAAGLVVTVGSNDQIKITNSGANPITFGINISGCST